MRNTITIDRLKETATYKELASKKEDVRIKFLEKKSEREKISHAFQVYKNTNHIPNTVSGINLAVVKDLIREMQPDASFMMTCENIYLNKI